MCNFSPCCVSVVWHSKVNGILFATDHTYNSGINVHNYFFYITAVVYAQKDFEVYRVQKGQFVCTNVSTRKLHIHIYIYIYDCSQRSHVFCDKQRVGNFATHTIFTTALSGGLKNWNVNFFYVAWTVETSSASYMLPISCFVRWSNIFKLSQNECQNTKLNLKISRSIFKLNLSIPWRKFTCNSIISVVW